MLLATVGSVDTTLAIAAEADPVASNTRIVLLSDSLSGRAGDQLADTVSVRVTDSTGRAVAEIPVRWIPLDGGRVEALSARTDSLGVAGARWTLANKTGSQRVRVQVGSTSARIPPATITAASMAGAAVGVVVMDGDKQRGTAGAELAKPVVLKVVDASGNGVADAELLLSPSGGAVADSAPRTNALGIVRTKWTLGREAKKYALAVHVAGVKTLVKVSAAAAPAAAANLSFDDAPGSAKSTKAKRLYVVVTDVYGNPVPDAKVSFSTRSGVVSPMRVVTDAKGRAALVWTLGAKPGEQTLSGAVKGRDVTGAYVTQVAEYVSRATKTTPVTRKKSSR
jgi:hypothetical protein